MHIIHNTNINIGIKKSFFKKKAEYIYPTETEQVAVNIEEKKEAYIHIHTYKHTSFFFISFIVYRIYI